MTKQEILEDMADELASISDSLAGIHEEMEEISMASKIMVILKMIEIRPDLKEKLRPMMDDLANALNLCGEETDEAEADEEESEDN